MVNFTPDKSQHCEHVSLHYHLAQVQPRRMASMAADSLLLNLSLVSPPTRWICRAKSPRSQSGDLIWTRLL